MTQKTSDFCFTHCRKESGFRHSNLRPPRQGLELWTKQTVHLLCDAPPSILRFGKQTCGLYLCLVDVSNSSGINLGSGISACGFSRANWASARGSSVRAVWADACPTSCLGAYAEGSRMVPSESLGFPSCEGDSFVTCRSVRRWPQPPADI